MKQKGRRNGSKRHLPSHLEPEVKSAMIEMKRRPRVVKEHDEMVLYINEGLATIINPGDSQFLERGMTFSLGRRKIVAQNIEIKREKYRCSQNHHKFLVVVRRAIFKKSVEGGVAV